MVVIVSNTEKSDIQMYLRWVLNLHSKRTKRECGQLPGLVERSFEPKL